MVSRATFYFYVILREPCERRISWNFKEILRLLALAINGYGIRLSPSARAPQDDVLLLRHSEGVARRIQWHFKGILRPLTKRYLIVLFGRVAQDDAPFLEELRLRLRMT